MEQEVAQSLLGLASKRVECAPACVPVMRPQPGYDAIGTKRAYDSSESRVVRRKRPFQKPPMGANLHDPAFLLQRAVSSLEGYLKVHRGLGLGGEPGVADSESGSSVSPLADVTDISTLLLQLLGTIFQGSNNLPPASAPKAYSLPTSRLLSSSSQIVFPALRTLVELSCEGEPSVTETEAYRGVYGAHAAKLDFVHCVRHFSDLNDVRVSPSIDIKSVSNVYILPGDSRITPTNPADSKDSSPTLGSDKSKPGHDNSTFNEIKGKVGEATVKQHLFTVEVALFPSDSSMSFNMQV